MIRFILAMKTGFKSTFPINGGHNISIFFLDDKNSLKSNVNPIYFRNFCLIEAYFRGILTIQLVGVPI